MIRRWRRGVVVLATLMLSSASALAQSPPSAKALESRLYAPCCYNGTLDIHESELARELRKEIESRIARGDTAEVIQGDFVARYGEKVLAARSDRPARMTGTLVVVLMLMAAAGLAVALRRWTRTERAGAPAGGATAGPSVRDELDARVDAELAELEG
jgi:cytochrome c-type biogenesis protein CcmH